MTTEWPPHSSIEADPSCPIALRPCLWRRSIVFTHRRPKHPKRQRPPINRKRSRTQRPRLRDANRAILATRRRCRNPRERKADASVVRGGASLVNGCKPTDTNPGFRPARDGTPSRTDTFAGFCCFRRYPDNAPPASRLGLAARRHHRSRRAIARMRAVPPASWSRCGYRRSAQHNGRSRYRNSVQNFARHFPQ